MKLISLCAAVLLAYATPDPAHARQQSTPRDALRACDQQAEYAESLQQLRQKHPGFTQRIAEEVTRGETPHPVQQRLALLTVERVFAFPKQSNPVYVGNEVGRRCTQAANAVLK